MKIPIKGGAFALILLVLLTIRDGQFTGID